MKSWMMCVLLLVGVGCTKPPIKHDMPTSHEINMGTISTVSPLSWDKVTGSYSYLNRLIDVDYFLHSSTKTGRTEAILYTAEDDTLISNLESRLVRASTQNGRPPTFWCGIGANDESFLHKRPLSGWGSVYGSASNVEDLKNTRFDPRHTRQAYMSRGETLRCSIEAQDELKSEAVILIHVSGTRP